MRVVIVGGGVAGLEALLALRELAGERVETTLVSASPDFFYKPFTVTEPFTMEPAERLALDPIAAELGARFVLGSLAGVRGEEHAIELSSRERLGYDALMLCVGGTARAAYSSAITFDAAREPLRIDRLIDAARGKVLAFLVPPGVSWPLPIYELALMTDRRAREDGGEHPRCVIVTPEPAPLSIFGRAASDALAQILAGRGIEFLGATEAREDENGEIVLEPGGARLEAAGAIALPVIDGPGIRGVPADEGGFLAIDEHARVIGADSVYAAGDGTNFPIKQGGIATQQADAAAAHIAAAAGADVEPKPFHPVLRGRLLLGADSISLMRDVSSGASRASDDYLWWPPHKISGRYLSPWLAQEMPHELEAPRRPLDVEIELPVTWHSDPLALDPLDWVE
jgi:sulfide:quinone oxidoreductase